MKYILKKKWHPSQEEEVGYVFKENDDDFTIVCTYPNKMDFDYNCSIKPHEIALLVDAGYLEKQEEKCGCGQLLSEHSNYTNGYCTNQSPIVGAKGEGSTLDLWTTEPPLGGAEEKYFYLKEHIEYTRVYVDSDVWIGDVKDKLRLRTHNCHKTKASAEEALKRLLEKE